MEDKAVLIRRSLEYPVRKDMKLITRPSLLFLLSFVTLAGCVHMELPHHGEVKDAETGESLEGTLVFMSLYTRCMWPLPHVGSDYRGSIEAVTGKSGRYWLPIDFTLSLPMCFAESKDYTFFKPNYFEEKVRRDSLLWGIMGGWLHGEEDKHSPGHVYLYKMKHYLNYLPYKYPHKYTLSSHMEEDSKYYNAYVEMIKKFDLKPGDDNGIFLRLPGRKFTRLYSRVSKSFHSPISKIINYAYNEAANEWLVVDGRGNVLAPRPSKLPKWNFISSDKMWDYPLYADNNHIFWPVEENMIPHGMKYEKGEIKSMPSSKGNISALAGGVGHFFTIEDNGSFLCEYSEYTRNWGKGDEFLPELVKCFTNQDLPSSKEDDTLNDSKFIYLSGTLNHGLFVITKTSRYWHIYNFYTSYDEKIKDVRLFIQEIALLFPVEKEITAFATDGGPFYIAFKDEGIRKYEISVPFNVPAKSRLKENYEFFQNSRQSRYPDIKSLAIGYAVNIPALYAVTGEDTVYRFSMDGIPDYQIKNE